MSACEGVREEREFWKFWEVLGLFWEKFWKKILKRKGGKSGLFIGEKFTFLKNSDWLLSPQQSPDLLGSLSHAGLLAVM